jgi:NAD(P)-dependent dehydrogenase (short-subunit alcohol dehydrogenase family)
MEFDNKTALITGAATGIGRSLAVGLAREGSDLALLDIDSERGQETVEQVRKEGRRAEFYRADASKRESLEEAIDAAWSAMGPIDLCCANAGIGAFAPLLEMESRDIEWLMRVNLFGVLDTVRAYVSHARKAKRGGHLMLTGSENSVAIPHALRRVGLGMYGVTKHGVLHMGDILRYELEPDGIGVSVLMPGPVKTEIGRSAEKRPDHLGGPAPVQRPDPSLLDLEQPFPPYVESDAAARIAIEGLRAERFMIPTHSHILDYARARLDELAAANEASHFEPGA